MSNDSEAADSEGSVDADAADDGEGSDGLEAGEFVEVAYTARTAADGHLVDTTDEAVAAEEGVGEDQEFGPRMIVLGEEHVFGPLDEDVIGRAVGDEGSVVVPAEEAFGEFDDEQVRTVSTDKIPEDDRYPGARVQVDGQQGVVETTVGGRARVDFNHPLAGEDVEYEYEIVDVVEDRRERARGLLSMLLDVDLDVWFETDSVEEEQLVEPEGDEEDESDAEATEDDETEGEETEDEEAEDEETEVEEAEVEESEAESGDDEPPEPEYETVEVEKESLYIEAIPALTMNQQWMMQKQAIAQQLIDLLGVDRVVIQETIDGGAGGLPGMMGGAGGAGGGDLEAALAEAGVDADDLDDVDDLAEELEGE